MNRLKNWFSKKPEKTQAQKNEDLHKKLKAGWDQNRPVTGGKQIDLIKVYTSRAENVYYVHKNILDLPVVRQLELAKALQAISFGVDDEYLDQWIKDHHGHIATGNQYQMSAHLTDLQHRRKRIPTEKMFLACSLALIYRHDENPYTWSSSMRDAKLREINSDPDLHAFFLSEGFQEGKSCLKVENLQDWKMQSLEDFLQHWAKQLMDNPTGTPTG